MTPKNRKEADKEPAASSGRNKRAEARDKPTGPTKDYDFSVLKSLIDDGA